MALELVSTVNDLLAVLVSCKGGETEEGAVDEGVDIVDVDDDDTLLSPPLLLTKPPVPLSVWL